MSLFRNLFKRFRKPGSGPQRRRLFLEPLESRQLLVADLIATKIANPNPVVAGTELTYSISVTNGGGANEAAENVKLTDAIPPGTSFVSFTAPDGWAPDPDVPFPNVGDTSGAITSELLSPGDGSGVVGVGETVNFTLVVLVLPGTEGPILNEAGFETTTPEDDPGTDRANTSTPVDRQYDLAVTSKTDTPDPVPVGENITYTIVIRNNGPSDAPAVTLRDVIPANTTYVSLTPAAGTTGFTVTPPGTAPLTASATGPLAAGATATFTLVVNVNAGTLDNTIISNTARVADDPLDPNLGNNFNSPPTTTEVEGPPIAELVVTKVDAADPVLAGANITYTITLQNIGSAAAAAVVLTDAIPANTTFQSFTQPVGQNFLLSTPNVGDSTGNVTASIASFPTGTATFTLVVRPNSNLTQGTTITNTASATTTSPEASTTNNSDDETTLVNVQANLGITKVDTPDPVGPGGNLTYTINVTTAGPSDAQTVVFTDDIPANTSLVSVNEPLGWTRTDTLTAGATTGTIRFTRATLPAGTAATEFIIVVQVNPSATNGTTITNTGTVTSPTDPTANSATSTTLVQVSGDLLLTKVDAVDPVVQGANISYTLTLTNNGPNAAQTVSLTDAIPADTTFVSFTQTGGPTFVIAPLPAVGASTGTVTATLASMAANATATFTYVVRVIPSTPNGTTITNVANVTSPTDLLVGNNQATQTTLVEPPGVPDVVVTKTDSPNPVLAGNELTYTIIVNNAGNGAAGTVTLNDTVPANTTFVSMNQTAGPAFTITRPAVGSTNSLVSATAASLAASASATFSLVVRVNPGTGNGVTINNTASATAVGDTNTGNNSDQEPTTVQTQADVAVTKSDSPDPVGVGGTISYAINVINSGPSNAQTVSLTDAIPANTTFVSFAAPAGWNVTTPAVNGTGTVTASLGSLASGTTASFTLVVRVNNTVASGATINNTAAVSTATSDPAAGNNSASASTEVVVPPDFGDAPTSYGTLLANNGAQHGVNPALRMGARIDSEANGQPTAAANGDDVTNLDDEDGVALSTALIVNRGAAAIVSASAAARLDAWVDFNRNGVFDASEKIANNLAVAAGSNSVFFNVPADAVTGASYARFRMSSAGGLGPTGPATDGEVEDYATSIIVVAPGTIGILPDPETPGQNMLSIVGTDANETIAVTQVRTHKLRVQVTQDRRNRGQFAMADFRRIVVFAGAGDDTVSVGLARPALLNGEAGADKLSGGGGFDDLFGGEGNDRLSGGAGNDFLYGEDGNDSLSGGDGNDVLVGGEGDDSLFGGKGHDLLIGGIGVDSLAGNQGDDILIGGTTTHDTNRAALAAIMASWTAKNTSFTTRVASLSGRLNSTTVGDDGSLDKLEGGSERDWYLDYLLADSIVGFKSSQDKKN